MLLVTCWHASEISRLDPLQEDCPHQFDLLLPSQCPALFSTCWLREYEWKLRFAQVLDVLEDIQHNLCLCSYLLKFKQANIWGQVLNTHVHKTLDTVKYRLSANVNKYCTAHAILMALSPMLEKSGWDSLIHELQDDDVHTLTVGLDGRTGGQQMLSWIWQTLGVMENQDEDLQDGEHPALKWKWRTDYCSSIVCGTVQSTSKELLMDQRSDLTPGRNVLHQTVFWLESTMVARTVRSPWCSGYWYEGGFHSIFQSTSCTFCWSEGYVWKEVEQHA